MKEFKAGDLVYLPYYTTLIIEIKSDEDNEDYPFYVLEKKLPRRHLINELGCDCSESKIPLVVHATQENQKILNKLYNVEFEKPPLRGSELTKKLLESGWDCVPCWISNCSDEHAREYKCKDIVNFLKFDKFYSSNATSHNFAVPFDPRTGEELTEEVLGD